MTPGPSPAGTPPTHEPTPTCGSSTHDNHDTPVPAVVAGIFDPGPVNGRPASEVAYCLRCAAVLELGDLFAPERALAPLPDLAEVYADRLGDTWTLADQEAILTEAAPRTVALLRGYSTEGR